VGLVAVSTKGGPASAPAPQQQQQQAYYWEVQEYIHYREGQKEYI
jgi:hypothetical protein